MRDWPNNVYEGSLEEACAAVAEGPYVERIGFEVEAADQIDGRRHVLIPVYDPGLAPWSGETVRCSSLSFDSLWRVLRVAKGYPGRMIVGHYPDDFPIGYR